MSKDSTDVNGILVSDYEIAYRILLLLSASTADRHTGSTLSPCQFYKIIGASSEDVDRVFEMLKDDGLIMESKDGLIWIG